MTNLDVHSQRRHLPMHVKHTCVISLPEDVGLADHHHPRQRRPPLRPQLVVPWSSLLSPSPFHLPLSLSLHAPCLSPSSGSASRVLLKSSPVGDPASRVSVRRGVAAATSRSRRRSCRRGGTERTGPVQAAQGEVPGFAEGRGKGDGVWRELRTRLRQGVGVGATEGEGEDRGYGYFGLGRLQVWSWTAVIGGCWSTKNPLLRRPACCEATQQLISLRALCHDPTSVRLPPPPPPPPLHNEKKTQTSFQKCYLHSCGPFAFVRCVSRWPFSAQGHVV